MQGRLQGKRLDATYFFTELAEEGVVGFHELGSAYIDIYNPINIVLEVSLFLVAMLVLYKAGDWKVFFKPDKTIVLIIPITTVLLPSTIGYPFSDSLLLTEPHWQSHILSICGALRYSGSENAVLDVYTAFWLS